MKRFRFPGLLLGGAALIGLINAFALGGAWYNRQGEPDSLLLLSERELARLGGPGVGENSGLTLQLLWEMAPEQPPMFSAAQMRRAGFSASEPACRRRPERAALVALELDGPAYRRALERRQQAVDNARAALAQAPEDGSRRSALENAERELDWTLKRSRLYVVDIDQDRAALRQRWPDRTRHAIVRGRVRQGHDCHALSGHLSGLDIPAIHVPQVLHAPLAELPVSHWQPTPGAAPLRVQLAFGRRLEPWLRGVEAPAPAQ